MISFHIDAKRQIDGFTLRWRCDGDKFSRMTYFTALQEPAFEPVPLKGRAFSFKRKLPWCDFDPGRDSRKGTAEVNKVSGQFFKRGLKPRRRPYPLPMSYSPIAEGTVKIVDGGCRVPARWELNRDNTQRNQNLKSY